MYEVEVKVPTPLGPVRERLADLDARRLGSIRQQDTYYDHPVRDFGETDEALRLRRETPVPDPAGRTSVDERAVDNNAEEAMLTYKGPLVDDRSKTREEVETSVADPDATDTLLRSVGFEPAANVGKVRERFEVNRYTVAFDQVDGLGTFVEVETVGAAGAVDTLRAGAVDLCRRLGLDVDAAVRTSYLELLEGQE